MSILSGSRYANSAVATLQVNGKPRQVILISPQQAPYSFGYQSYQVTEADTVQSLASAFFGDPTQWWQIADANPEIEWWGPIPPGTIIRIPSV